MMTEEFESWLKTLSDRSAVIYHPDGYTVHKAGEEVDELWTRTSRVKRSPFLSTLDIKPYLEQWLGNRSSDAYDDNDLVDFETTEKGCRLTFGDSSNSTEVYEVVVSDESPGVLDDYGNSVIFACYDSDEIGYAKAASGWITVFFYVDYERDFCFEEGFEDLAKIAKHQGIGTCEQFQGFVEDATTSRPDLVDAFSFVENCEDAEFDGMSISALFVRENLASNFVTGLLKHAKLNNGYAVG